MFLVYKFETFKNCRGKAHCNYDYCYNLHFFILRDIWSTVENYFQKINPLPPFYSLPPPPKNSKSSSPPLFANIENFSGLPCRKGGKDTSDCPLVYAVLEIVKKFGKIKIYFTVTFCDLSRSKLEPTFILAWNMASRC